MFITAGAMTFLPIIVISTLHDLANGDDVVFTLIVALSVDATELHRGKGPVIGDVLPGDESLVQKFNPWELSIRCAWS